MLQCRFFDEALDAWSTEGCETVELSDRSGVGCSCSHLSDFIAVKVPTQFVGDVEFAALDVASRTTLHCACTRGVEGTLEKSATTKPAAPAAKRPSKAALRFGGDGVLRAGESPLPFQKVIDSLLAM